jgi:large subunit ribosomal protein L1
MPTQQELEALVREARASAGKRGFAQSFELIVTLKGLDPKKDRELLTLSEVIALPHAPTKRPRVCAVASGELELRLRRLEGLAMVLSPEELDRLAASKRAARKLARQVDFVVAEAPLMPRVGRALGPYLGPRGKAPIPLFPAAPAEETINRLLSSTRLRSKGHLAFSCRIGDEGMADAQIARNALAVLEHIARKLPKGEDNIKKVLIKATMGPPRALQVVAR